VEAGWVVVLAHHHVMLRNALLRNVGIKVLRSARETTRYQVRDRTSFLLYTFVNPRRFK